MKILNMLSYSDLENYNYKPPYAKDALVGIAKNVWKQYLSGKINPNPKNVADCFDKEVRKLFFGVMTQDENFDVIKDDLMLLVDENNIKFNEHLDEMLECNLQGGVNA